MAQTWRETEKARTRQRYLDAAAELFARRGFHAVSIDELGAAAGVSGPALYRHFAGKEAVLAEILVGVSERLLTGLRETLALNAPPRETLALLIRFHLDFAMSERDVIRLQDRELANLPADANHTVRALQRRYLEGWIDVLDRVDPAAPAPPRARQRIRMLAVFGILNSTAHSSTRDRAADVRRVLGDAAAMVLLGTPLEGGVPRA